MRRPISQPPGQLRKAIAVALTLCVALATPAVAFAHPLGNFTINHYAGLRVSREAVTIDYVLDMAEIPAFQEMPRIDANGDGQADDAESARYQAAQCQTLRADLDLRVDGSTALMSLTSSTLEFPPGAGGLSTLRLTCGFRASIAVSESARLEFADNSYADRLGWREIVVTADGVSLHGDFASSSVSNRLTAYPDDMLSSPLDQRAVTLTIAAGSSSQPADQPNNHPTPQSGAQAATQPSSRRDDAFTQLIALPDLNLATLLLALVVSFAWGAMHALSPGHGKTMVAAYLVGARGTTRHALVLGLTVTLTHTAGVFALGLVTLLASNYILPEQLYPYLSLASGLLVVGIGLTLMITRYRAARSGRSLLQLAPAHPDHEHVGDDHDHHAPHNPLTIRLDSRIHAHAHQHDDHSHDHHHADHAYEHHHDHDHHHGSGSHTHNPVDENGRITMRSLVALGVSGGLIPCPTALVVLLSAIALGRVGFGLTLILAFSAGLAAVLMGIGLLLVHGRRLIDRLPVESRLLRLMPLAGAVLVIVTGVVMTAQAIASVGRMSV